MSNVFRRTYAQPCAWCPRYLLFNGLLNARAAHMHSPFSTAHGSVQRQPLQNAPSVNTFALPPRSFRTQCLLADRFFGIDGVPCSCGIPQTITRRHVQNTIATELIPIATTKTRTMWL
eukprot:6028116-Amphidinium_carterae.1